MLLDYCTKQSLELKPVISEDGSEICQAKTARVLGVRMSSDLLWTAHVDDAVAIASQRLYVILSLRYLGLQAAYCGRCTERVFH